MIESRVFLPANNEQDALKLFAQNRMLMKRGVHQQLKTTNTDQELKSMRKKVTLLEVALHSLKHKLQDVELSSAKNIEEAKVIVAREKDKE